MTPSDSEIRDVLTRARTVAIVGLSDKPDRDSNEVARYLQSRGYRVIPINPAVPVILGERSYPSVTAIPREVRVDIVDVFRRSDQVPPIAVEATRRGVKVLWMQLGVDSPEAASLVREGGGIAFENLCIMTQHRRLGLGPVGAAK
ncbi:MAG: CoA-binding protein [Thermoplasmata archaeon]